MSDKPVYYYESIIGQIKVGEPAELVLDTHFGHSITFVTRDVIDYNEQTEVFETDMTVYAPA